MKAVIMAGGAGTRLYPLTESRPKPLMQVMGVPLIDHIIDLLRRHGVTEVVLTLGTYADQIIDHVKSADYGITVRWVREDEPLGTAGGVKNASRWLDETFLVVSGDALTDANLTAAVGQHTAHGGWVTMLLKEVGNIYSYGMVVTDRTGRVCQFREKPKSEAEVVCRIANTGMYVVDPQVLQLIPEGVSFDFAKDLFPLMLSGDLPLYGFPIQEYWCDVGSLNDYWRAHFDVMKGRVRLPLAWQSGRTTVCSAGAFIHPDTFIGEPVFIGENARLEQAVSVGPYSVISQGAVLRTGSVVSGSVIGWEVEVGEGAEVIHSVIGGGTYVPKHSRVVGTVIAGPCVKGLMNVSTEGPVTPYARRRWTYQAA